MPTNRSTSPDPAAARAAFLSAERRVLDRHGADVVPTLVEVPGGHARVLTGGEGPPVVLVIGGGMAAAMWAPLLPYLAGFRTHLVELPGAGLTDPVGYRRGELRTTAVDFLDRVLDGLGLDRVPIVGHSMGGLWATWLALERPDRVTALAYVGCPALVLGTSAPLPMRLSTITALHGLVTRIDPPSPKQVDRSAAIAGEDLRDLPELRDLFVAAGRLPHASEEMHRLLRAAIRVRGTRPDAALGAEELRQLRRPIQVIWGENDTFGPPEVGRRMADLVADGEFHLVGGGHGPWFSHADEVGPPLARFLAAHAPTTDELHQANHTESDTTT
jgi:pimeloyl-ACP methyl ester carboxylesterase